MPTVSVVIPTIGRTEQLRHAIQSVEEQTVNPDAMAVVDGSDDRAAEPVVSEMNLPFECIYIRQHGDGGPSEARNIGIGATESDFIAFLDDDDRWAPRKLETQLATYRETGAGLVFCGVQNVRPDGTLTNRTRPTSPPDARTILIEDGIGSPSSVLVRRAEVEAIGGFDESLPVREDWEFYIRLLQSTDAVAIPEPLVRKEYSVDGLSRNVELAERCIMRVFEKHREKYDDELERRFKANNHFILGRRYAKAGTTAKARSHFFESLKHEFRIETAVYLFASCFGPWGYNRIRQFSQRLSVRQSA